MKRILYCIIIVIFVGCASVPTENSSSQKRISAPVQKLPYTVVQHKNSLFGGELPSWVSQEFNELEAQPEYKDKYVFKAESPEAKDYEGAKILAKKMDAADQIGSMITQRIQTKFAGSQVGDKNKVETYFESVVKTAASAKVTGMRQEKEFWVQFQYNKPDGTPDPDRLVFKFFLLYTVPKAMLDEMIKKAFETVDGQDPPKTEDQITARKRVKEAFETGF